MDFDHHSEKLYNVSKLLSLGCAWDRIITEINKCNLVCIICHRVKTVTGSYPPPDWYKTIGMGIVKIKQEFQDKDRT